MDFTHSCDFGLTCMALDMVEILIRWNLNTYILNWDTAAESFQFLNLVPPDLERATLQYVQLQDWGQAKLTGTNQIGAVKTLPKNLPWFSFPIKIAFHGPL